MPVGFHSASPGHGDAPDTRPNTGMNVSAILDLILAPACLACSGWIDSTDPARLVCRRCRSLLRVPPAPICARCGAPLLRTGRTIEPTCSECADWPASIRFVRSACLLHPPADRIVHQFKYGGWSALAEPMADRLLRLQLPDELEEEVRVVVPVPTTASRRRERGYNQAERLAAAFACMRRWRLLDTLERTGARATQVALQPLARAANVAGAFRLIRPVAGADPEAELLDQHILLIDDVLTTGATSAECAAVLVGAGARCVSVLTFARAFDARRLIGR